MKIPRIKLHEIVEPSTGTSNPSKQPEKSFIYVDVAAVDNVTKTIVGERSIIGANAPSRARKIIRAGDILVSTVRPNLNAVSLVSDRLDKQVASTGFCVLRATKKVLPEYIFAFVRSRVFVDGLTTLVAGAMYPAVTDSQVLNQELPLPSIAEQRRIVDILSRAEGIVRLRREAQKKTAEIIPALFIDMFGDPTTNPKGWPLANLDAVSQIISGVTKGRKLNPAELIELPYMRVGNVKDGYLDLSEVKTIAVRDKEIEKYRLLPGDLLMTEGGDPDKLGRAAIWNGEIDVCLHQNHIFKVRPDPEQLLPEYLRELAGSSYGKAYFLRVAKKTTGIATINRTQLGNFPVLIPSLEIQREFVKKFEAVRSIQLQQTSAFEKARSTFDALLAGFFQ